MNQNYAHFGGGGFLFWSDEPKTLFFGVLQNFGHSVYVFPGKRFDHRCWRALVPTDGSPLPSPPPFSVTPQEDWDGGSGFSFKERKIREGNSWYLHEVSGAAKFITQPVMFKTVLYSAFTVCPAC